jgi:hypothetical protein
MKAITLKNFIAPCKVLPGLLLAVTGCASWQAPTQLDDAKLQERAVTETIGDITVKGAVLSNAENEQFFGANLNEQGIQTVWIEIANNSTDTLWLLTSGTDPDYFSPLEVAWPFHKKFSSAYNDQIDQHFDELSFENPVPPGVTRSGFLYTNPHYQTRVLNVDLLGQQTLYPFTLFPPVPGQQDEERLKGIYLIVDSAMHNSVDSEELLRDTLEQLPCCTTSSTDGSTGGPVNIILIGDLVDVASALVRRGYRQEPLPVDTTQSYYGRPPDLVMRKSGQGGATSVWLRAWMAPFSYQGHPIVLLQSGRPVGGRFTDIESGTIMLHPDIDEIRGMVIQDMMYSGGLDKLGFVAGIPPVTTDYMSKNLDTQPYHTDGLRAVMFIITRPLSLSDIKILDWVPLLQRREAEAAAELSSQKNNEQSVR